MNLLKPSAVLVIPLALSGCLYGQCMDGACALERAEYLKSIKAYGEYWTKPGMTKESWRQDWVACGGRANGQYSGNVPPGSTDAVSAALWEKARKKLDACMKEKGYAFSYTHP